MFFARVCIYMCVCVCVFECLCLKRVYLHVHACVHHNLVSCVCQTSKLGLVR